MKREKIEFPGSLSYNLSASLDLPEDEKPQAYALFAHCFTCTKNLRAIHNINKALTSHKIAVLRFDFTGLGESEGDFADTNFSSNVGDLVAAAEFLKKNYQAPKILVGHSLGGAAVLQAAGEIPWGFESLALRSAKSRKFSKLRDFFFSLKSVIFIW